MKNAPRNPTIEDYLAPPDVHELERERVGGGIVTFILAMIVLVVEYWIARYTLDGHPLALLWHLLVVGVLAVLAFVMPLYNRETRFILLLLMSVSVTGPFGALGVMLTIISYLWFTRTAYSFDEWFNSIFPRLPQSNPERIYQDIIIGRDESSTFYSVIPFMDVIAYGSEVQKRRALGKMTANFHPAFAGAFKRALSDKSNTIRVLAATGISRIEAQFLDRLMRLSELKEEHGNDPAVIWAIAEHYDNYAYTGLLDVAREQNNRQQALDYYHAYLNLKPSDLEVRNRIGRILIRNGDYDKACLWFRQCLDQGYTSPAITQWYSEALYNCGRYGELRRFRALLPPASPESTAYDPSLQEAFNLWAGAKA